MLVFIMLLCMIGLYWVFSAAWIAAQRLIPDQYIREVQVGDRVFHIPQEYYKTAHSMPSWMGSLPGLHDGGDIMSMYLRDDEVVASVPGYIPRDPETVFRKLVSNEDFSLYIKILKPDGVEHYLDPFWMKDIWAKTGYHKSRYVETDPQTGYFRVYEEKEYDRSWKLLKVNPEIQERPSDLFSYEVGDCQAISKGYRSHPVSCSSYIVFENVYIRFRTNGPNIKHVDEIRAFLVKLVGGWLVSKDQNAN
ncbi:MAG: hypothetical protein COB46_10785 [Rhodospirillaceae bacterium]|nr:MAG: hypothetical protein COB46_10785 [Rhodospirillaceae bacterium]